MSAQSEQQKAREAYAAGRQQRESGAARMGQDNARIDGNNTSARNPGGAR
ncbi:hypothetical protein AB0N14_17645 [Streptomyces sp. NPDC051104]